MADLSLFPLLASPTHHVRLNSCIKEETRKILAYLGAKAADERWLMNEQLENHELDVELSFFSPLSRLWWRQWRKPTVVASPFPLSLSLPHST